MRTAMVVLTAWTLATTLVACGGEEETALPTVSELLPASNAVSGWAQVTAGVAGRQTGTTEIEVEAYIDGAMDPFADFGFSAFGRDFYTDGTHSAELQVWQMRDVAASRGLYEAMPTDYGAYALSWAAESLGDAGRIADNGNEWRLNARKGPFLMTLAVSPNDTAGKDASVAFLRAVIAKVP